MVAGVLVLTEIDLTLSASYYRDTASQSSTKVKNGWRPHLQANVHTNPMQCETVVCLLEMEQETVPLNLPAVLQVRISVSRPL
ncbi:hypothetical protein AMECASPLE_018431 [Ameca splendens]|uniref:Secreted protein n=1 Tax=Ameca splendens TaxID=208324 RepID=A0ABV1A9J6_9TELE